MGTFTEWLFYCLAPLGFLWSITHIPDTSSCQTIGCFIGIITGVAFMTFIPISIGLVLRRRRIKKEKAKQKIE